MRLATTTVCVAALAFAAPALASYAPKLAVRQGGDATILDVSGAPTDDATAKLTFFAPAGAGAAPAATPGSTIGTVEVRAAAGALGGVTLVGTVQPRAAETLAEAATKCTGTATHSAYWGLALSAPGQKIELPLFVDPVPAFDRLAPLVSYALTLCLPPPDLPESLGGAPFFGAKVFEAQITLRGVFSPPPSGDNLWRVLATPYLPGQGTPDPESAVEAQSFVETATITLGTPRRTLTRAGATFQASGRVDLAGLSDTAATVSIARGTTATRLAVFARPPARVIDAYSLRFSIRRVPRPQVLFLQAAAAAPQRDLAETACKSTFDAPCIGATAGGFVAKSTTRRIVVPAALANR